MFQIKKISSLFLMLFTINNISYAQTNTQEINSTCRQLFQESELIIAEADKQPGTHLQVEKIKQQMEEAKKDILSMEKMIQAKACELGLAKLEELKQ